MTFPESTDQPVNESTQRCGFVALLGRPNAGKSTLLNALIGEKVAIVSAKPQTTRDRLRGILTEGNTQIVFVDTPGLIDPHDRLNEALMEEVRQALDGIDLALHLVDATQSPALTPPERAVLESLPCPRLLVPTKLDLLAGAFDAAAWSGGVDLGSAVAVCPVSAVSGSGLEDLLTAVSAHIPEGPWHFDPDEMTDRDLRFLAREAVREKVFDLTGQELPYATAVMIDEFREEAGHKVYIAATIHVERESQKGMIVGKQGSMIREIGQTARRDIEELVGTAVFLDLRVKVRKNWRKHDADLRMFGYKPPKVKR